MRQIKNAFLLALLLVVSMAQAQTQPPKLPVDTAVRIGKLQNGLTYYIRHNNWPEHRANFYIAQKVGSIEEEESQRGLAHFLEHMCFNGSEHFNGNDMIRYCESIGVKFGRDLNAYTSIDQTVYNIDNVPTARQGALDSCLLILRDWAGSLTLDPKEIDKERGVIHEEWRLRTGASSRMFERNLPTLYPGSKYGVRYPIGLMSVVDSFKPKELVDYYHKWYHPSNQGIIVVGDVDVDKTEAEIKRLFGDMKNPENPAPIVSEPVPDNAEPIVVIDKDKEQDVSIVNLFFKHGVYPDSAKNSILYLMANYIKGAAMAMLNGRLVEATQKGDCPYTIGNAFDGDYIYSRTKGAVTIAVLPKDQSQIIPATKAAMVEAIRAWKFGFTPTEYKRYQASVLSGLDKMYSNKDKRPNSQFYEEYKGNFLSDEPIVPIDYYYETMKKLVPAIPIDAVNMIMADLIHNSDSNLVVLNLNVEKDGNVYPTKADLLDAVAAARAENITPYVDNVKDEPLIKTLPKAGTITKETTNNKLGYTELTLSNGAKVILKKTDYKADEVLLNGQGEGGGSLYGEKDYPNIKAFNQIIGASGLGNFSLNELQKALAGKIANANLTIDDRYMGINGSSTPKDLRTMMEMAYLYFTGINKDQESFNNQINLLEVALKNRALSPENAFSDSLTATTYGHNQRLAEMTEKDISSISYDRILQMARERTANAAGWTFTITGNFDTDSIRPLICQYVASLPTVGNVEKGHRVTFMQEGVIDNTFTRKQETPKAMSYMIWHNEDIPYTLENSIRNDMAGQILQMIYTDKIREKESAAYAVGAQGVAGMENDYHDMVIWAVCPMKPEKKDVALGIMRDEVPALAKSCDASMLAKVKEYMLKNYADKRKTNGYWNGVIRTFWMFGIDMDTDYKRIVEAQTPGTVEAFMADFIKANNRIEVTMLPGEGK